MSVADDWQRAFARQAKADFEMWDRLQDLGDVPKCQKLHFLQMACEKLVKAHLCGTVKDPYEIQRRHAYVAKHLPVIAKYHYARRKKSLSRRDPLFRQIRQLAREIELLAPAVDDGGRRRDNCEYPWELPDGSLRVPAEHTFGNLSLLTEPVGKTLLKIVNEAIVQLA